MATFIAMKRLIPALIFFSAFACVPDNESLEKEITSILSKEKVTFAVAFKDLQTGEQILINEKEQFHAASTMKTPVMAEVFKQAEAGKFKLQDSVIVRNDFKSIVDGSAYSLSVDEDSELKLYGQIGKKRTIESLVYDMIIMSSNLATNMVIEIVDAKNVTATMRSIGANDIQVLRGVEDDKAFERGLNNTTTAFDLMLLYEKIASEEMVSADASKKMVDILLDQQFNEIIPAKLPKDIRVAHKTGSITGVRHDTGIVFLPDGKKYVLILLSKELGDEEAGIKAMSEVSARIYEHVMR